MRVALLFLSFLLLSSCTVYTEKQSEALSKVVYASRDSMEAARIDLADKYVTETTRLVRPPKNRIKIESIYQKSVQQHIETIGSGSNREPIPVNKQRMVIIPEKYRADTVVVVSTEEYQRLLKDKETFAQFHRYPHKGIRHVLQPAQPLRLSPRRAQRLYVVQILMDIHFHQRS